MWNHPLEHRKTNWSPPQLNRIKQENYRTHKNQKFSISFPLLSFDWQRPLFWPKKHPPCAHLPFRPMARGRCSGADVLQLVSSQRWSGGGRTHKSNWLWPWIIVSDAWGNQFECTTKVRLLNVIFHIISLRKIVFSTMVQRKQNGQQGAFLAAIQLQKLRV